MRSGRRPRSDALCTEPQEPKMMMKKKTTMATTAVAVVVGVAVVVIAAVSELYQHCLLRR